jgi:hypothetical protein
MAADDLATAKLGHLNGNAQMAYAERADVHAVLSRAAGTGSHYTDAETWLAGSATPTPLNNAIAMAHARLATTT